MLERNRMMIDQSPIKVDAPCRGELWYPPRPTEFEIQAFIYSSLLQLGYDVRGEVPAKGGRCRFDIVVYRMTRTGAGIRPMPVRIVRSKILSWAGVG
jgi:hypothetical protein